MSALTPAAREQIRAGGVSVAAYVRHYSDGTGRWYGDACGCVDDRCIGYHHDEADECGCVPAWVDDVRAAMSATRN